MPEDEPQGPPHKRRKIENNVPVDNTRRKVVQNPTPNEEYKMRDGEEYSKVFGGHQNVCHKVDWPGGEKMCPRFHSRYYCFGNCNNVESHVPQSQVPSTKNKRLTRTKQKEPKKAMGSKFLETELQKELIQPRLMGSQYPDTLVQKELIQPGLMGNQCPDTLV